MNGLIPQYFDQRVVPLNRVSQAFLTLLVPQPRKALHASPRRIAALFATRVVRCRLHRITLLLTIACGLSQTAVAEPLDGTSPLPLEGDVASQLVAGADRFLLRRIEESVQGRSKRWQRDTSSAAAYNHSIEPNRQHLAWMLG